jgi:4-amino-4-deoxy-L-arabinose transferase-like glycosyltransferase
MDKRSRIENSRAAVGEEILTNAPVDVALRARIDQSAPDSLPEARWSILLLITVLVLGASFILPGITRGEFNINIDEAYHATTGLYFADFFRDLPLRHPVQYTYEYYAQYPALGLVHWPPLFHAIEGVMFLVLGPSVVSARLTTFLFAVFGLCFWFKLVRELDNEWTAAASTLVLAGLPSLLLYEKAVMLEIPSLSLCFAATYCWLRYTKGGAPRFAYWFGVLAGLALLVKQQSVYLAPLCLLTVLAERKWRLLFRRATLAAVGICAFVAGPFYVLSLGIDGKSIRANVLSGVEKVAQPFAYYVKMLPGTLGLVLLALGVAGMVSWFWWRKRESSPIMLAWIVGWYVTFTFIGTKTPRYIVYWLPAFIYFAVAPLTSKALPRRLRPVSLSLALVLVAASSWVAWRYQRPYVSGYAKVANDLVSATNGGVVLFDGDLAGNFIFYMRASDPNRRFVVLRKALYATEVMAQFGTAELVHSSADVETVLNQYGIQYVVVEHNTPLQFNSQKILRELLQTSQFKLVQEVSINSNTPDWRRRTLRVYQNLDVAAPTDRFLRLKMLSMGHDIVVPLDHLLK